MMPATNNAQQGDPKLTEVWEPVPEVVDPGNEHHAPSDAIILFDGRSLSSWEGLTFKTLKESFNQQN